MAHVTIPLDRVRTLRFSINAMRDLEKVFGKSIMTIFSESPGIEEITHLVHVGLKHGGSRKLSVDVVGDLLQEHFLDRGKGIQVIMEEYVLEAMKESGFLPADEEDEEVKSKPDLPLPKALT